MALGHRTHLRSLLVWLLAVAAPVVAVRLLAVDVRTGARALGSGRGGFEPVLDALAALLVMGCATWAAWVTTVVLAQALRRGRGAARTGTMPGWAQRAVVAACGLSVLAAAPALAEPGRPAHPPRHDHVAVVLSGLPLPDRATGPAAPAALPHPADEVTVRAGDTLWSIAGGRLGATGEQRVAEATRALYRRNRDVIGDDPDLIHPGQTLRVSPPATSPDR